MHFQYFSFLNNLIRATLLPSSAPFWAFLSAKKTFMFANFYLWRRKVFAFKKLEMFIFPPALDSFTPSKIVSLEKSKNIFRTTAVNGSENFLIPIKFDAFDRFEFFGAISFHTKAPVEFLSLPTARLLLQLYEEAKVFKDRTWAGAKYQNYVKNSLIFYSLFFFPLKTDKFKFNKTESLFLTKKTFCHPQGFTHFQTKIHWFDFD